ncbi:class I SAM-dependent methyltransferase [Jatrophihabitans sp.]|uniref:class I SAM-dependent methyltransferase n=1 Tax=Jatrophihabitans sp. TaxID=1932789 RepID=UPI002CC87E46|nr:class I SAM-dependent methyltransferase [Jatrophihabitans sp.]
MDAESQPATRWSAIAGHTSGPEYAARFARLAAAGRDVHGEAGFCAGLLPPPATVLDAGCGTGRVAARLADLGYRTLGVDVDASMLAEARRARPDLPWLAADLATLPDRGRLADLAGVPELAEHGADLVVAAGNVIPLLAPGTLDASVQRLAAVLAPDGLLVAGFGLDAAHLPAGCPVTPAEDYLAACAAAGLTGTHQYGSWDGAGEPDGYLVSVHRRISQAFRPETS